MEATISRSNAAKQVLVCTACIAGIVLLIYWPLLEAPDGLLAWPHSYNDAVKQYLGQRILVGQSLRMGHFPAWDPYCFAGRPVLANPQTAVLYPGTWLFAIAPSAGGLSWNMVLHVMWFSLGVWLLARCHRVPPLFAVIGAALAASSLYNTGHILEGHLPHMSAASWYPWLLVAYDRLFHGRGPSRVAIALLAICTALCALAGHGQEAYYAGLGIGLLFVIDAIWLVIRRAPRRLGRLLACAGAAGVLALLLSGVQLLPQLATLPFTVRGGELALRDAWSFSSSLRNLAQLVFPFTLGCYTHDNYSGPWNYWEGNLGVGLAVIIAAILGFTLGFRDRNVRRLGLLALFSVLFALGKEGRVFEVLYRVLPGVAMFRAPGRMLFWFTTLVPVLAALGLHRLWERVGFCSPRAGFWVTVFVAFAGGAASVVMPVVCGVSPVTPFVSWARATAPTHNVLDALVLQGGAALGVLTFAAVLPVFWAALADNRPMARPAHGAVFLALLGGCMLQAIAGARHLIRVVPAREAVPMELASAVKEAMSRCPEQPCRVLAASGLIPDTAAVMAGIEKVTGYDAFQLRGFAMALSAQGTGDPTYILRHYDRDPTAFPAILWTNEFLDAWGVHFVLASRDWVRSRLVDPGGWHEVPLPRMGRRDVVLLQRVRPAPRYRLKMPGNRASAREAVHLASVNDPTAGRWQFVVSAEEDGQFEIAHPYAPGIRVLVDGETTEALSDEHAVLVVRLNKGEHRVAVEYRPPWFLTGCLCTACGLLAAVGLVLWPFRRRGGDPAQARVPEACRGAA